MITDMLDSQAGLGEEIAKEIIESSNVEDDALIAGTQESGDREARLLSGLLYWITTTTTSTMTSYTGTTTVGSVYCTPAGATLCG